MLRRHARRGVSVVAVQAALLASSSGAFAQNSSAVLPPVTVDAPAAVQPKPRKPAVSTAAARSRSAKPAGERAAPTVTGEQGAGGARASLEPPVAVAVTSQNGGEGQRRGQGSEDDHHKQRRSDGVVYDQ